MSVECRRAVSPLADPLLVAPALLGWYDAHARLLPWRMPPGSNGRMDAYRVWLSEIMLQQTTVAAVIPYFERFTRQWPSMEALAAAADTEVMAAWAGLGYYARARNLLACARAVVHDHGGRFPASEAELRALPGIGDYTAAAIAAIAFGARAVVVDANVERVVARLCAIATPLPGARREIRAAADAMTPPTRAGDFAQAMMDLGSSICTARNPQCLLCPLRKHCRAAALGDPAVFPFKPAKVPKPRRSGRVWWLERGDGSVWLVRRPEKGMLGGMRSLPSSDWHQRTRFQEPGVPPLSGAWLPLNRAVEHMFTHFALQLTVERLRVDNDVIPPGEGEWWPRDRLRDAGLPSLFVKVVKVMEKEE